MLKWILAAAALLILLSYLLCRYIGKKFMKNLERKNPGDKFTGDFDVSFYQNSPVRKLAADGMAYMKTLQSEEVFITSRDGLKLHATLFPPEDGGKNYVIGIHGFQSHAWNEYGPHIAYYRSLGYGMLLPDDRAHGLSEGKFITMGVRDRLDCIDWANYMVGRFGPDVKLLLHGVSMGGAAVLSASAEKDLPPQVFGAVSDCGFTSVEESLSFQMKNLYRISPAVPLAVCRWFASHRAGFDFGEARPIDRVRYAKVPILFVQGEADHIVPKFMAEKLYDACTADKKLVMVKNASHAESIAIAPDAYHRGILWLINR